MAKKPEFSGAVPVMISAHKVWDEELQRFRYVTTENVPDYGRAESIRRANANEPRCVSPPKDVIR